MTQSNPDASAATNKLFGLGSKLRNSLRGSSRNSSKVSASTGPALPPREIRDGSSRPQPAFARVPSRRYQRQRLDNPDGADGKLQTLPNRLTRTLRWSRFRSGAAISSPDLWSSVRAAGYGVLLPESSRCTVGIGYCLPATSLGWGASAGNLLPASVDVFR